MKLAHSLLAIAVLASTASGAAAADLLGPADPIYSSSLFNFEGMYLGVTGGGALASSGYGTLGVVVGSNFAITDGIIAGVEFQGDTYWNGSGLASYDALAFGRIGGFVMDNTMLYGELGAGFVGSNVDYGFGAGAEMALSGPLSIKAEFQGLGAFGAAPSVGKATVGLIWHMN